MSVTEKKKAKFLLHLEAKTRTAALRVAPGARCAHLAADLISALADLNAALAPCRTGQNQLGPRTEAKRFFFL